MGDVTAGENDGVLETTGVKADVAEPDVGKTDQKTDLHHRADKEVVEFDPEVSFVPRRVSTAVRTFPSLSVVVVVTS